MLDTIAKASAGAARETLTYVATRNQVLEVVEAQDADSPALVSVIIAPKGSNTLGACLVQGPTALPGGQLYWSGELLLEQDQEVRAYFDVTAANDRLFLTIKSRGVK